MEFLEGVMVFEYPSAAVLRTSPEHAASLVAAGTHRYYGFTLKNHFADGTNYVIARTIQWEGEREQPWPVRNDWPVLPAVEPSWAQICYGGIGYLSPVGKSEYDRPTPAFPSSPPEVA